MASVVLMACGSKGGASSSDTKMVEESANKVISSLGSSAETIDADLIKMGFKKYEGRQGAPARKAAKLAQAGMDYVVYLYNITDEADVEEPSFYQDLARSKKLAVYLYVAYQDGKSVGVGGECFISQAVSNCNDVYTEFSNNVYASIPSQTDIEWRAEAYTMTESKYYNNHADLIKNFSQIMADMEFCSFKRADGTVEYELLWTRSIDNAEARQQGYEPFCRGGFDFRLK